MVPGKKLLLCEAWCTVLCIHWNVYVLCIHSGKCLGNTFENAIINKEPVDNTTRKKTTTQLNQNMILGIQ